jgi:hypothetical protein
MNTDNIFYNLFNSQTNESLIFHGIFFTVFIIIFINFGIFITLILLIVLYLFIIKKNNSIIYERKL